jgi:pimeloyl-[acyl-carrier protein] methyl ester esterase
MKKHLVMLHGFGCDSRIFASIGTKLSKDYDVLMVDLPGHGQTKGKFESFSFAAYSILHALDQYLGEPYSLLGWSMGGQIALEMYKQSKKKIETGSEKCDCGHDHGHEHGHDHAQSPIGSLILVSSTPRFVASDDFEIGMNTAVFKKFMKSIESDHKKALADFFRLMFTQEEDGSRYIDELMKYIPSQETLKQCMDSFKRFDERHVLPSINIPTLIMTGDSDKIIDPKASFYMSQEIKNSSLNIYKDTGHAPHITREKEMIYEISKFLG